MKRIATPLIGLIALFTLAFAVPAAHAATFVGTGEIDVTVAGATANITVGGPLASEAVEVVHFREIAPDKVHLKVLKLAGGKAEIALGDGNRFQLRNGKGEWLYLTPKMENNPWNTLKLTGRVHIRDDDPGGCALRVE